MNPSQLLLRLNIGFIVHETAGYSREFPINIDQIKLQPDQELTNLDGVIKITRTAEGLLVQVKMTARARIECVRCLDEFTQLLSIDFADLYNFSRQVTNDSDLIVPEDGMLDMVPSIREEMLVAIPLKPLCRQDCKGLCPLCGENRNTVQCNHIQESIDPRLESLKALLNED